MNIPKIYSIFAYKSKYSRDKIHFGSMGNRKKEGPRCPIPLF